MEEAETDVDDSDMMSHVSDTTVGSTEHVVFTEIHRLKIQNNVPPEKKGLCPDECLSPSIPDQDRPIIQGFLQQQNTLHDESDNSDTESISVLQPAQFKTNQIDPFQILDLSDNANIKSAEASYPSLDTTEKQPNEELSQCMRNNDWHDTSLTPKSNKINDQKAIQSCMSPCIPYQENIPYKRFSPEVSPFTGFDSEIYSPPHIVSRLENYVIPLGNDCHGLNNGQLLKTKEGAVTGKLFTSCVSEGGNSIDPERTLNKVDNVSYTKEQESKRPTVTSTVEIQKTTSYCCPMGSGVESRNGVLLAVEDGQTQTKDVAESINCNSLGVVEPEEDPPTQPIKDVIESMNCNNIAVLDADGDISTQIKIEVTSMNSTTLGILEADKCGSTETKDEAELTNLSQSSVSTVNPDIKTSVFPDYSQIRSSTDVNELNENSQLKVATDPRCSIEVSRQSLNAIIPIKMKGTSTDFPNQKVKNNHSQSDRSSECSFIDIEGEIEHYKKTSGRNELTYTSQSTVSTMNPDLNFSEKYECKPMTNSSQMVTATSNHRHDNSHPPNDILITNPNQKNNNSEDGKCTVDIPIMDTHSHIKHDVKKNEVLYLKEENQRIDEQKTLVKKLVEPEQINSKLSSQTINDINVLSNRKSYECTGNISPNEDNDVVNNTGILSGLVMDGGDVNLSQSSVSTVNPDLITDEVKQTNQKPNTLNQDRLSKTWGNNEKDAGEFSTDLLSQNNIKEFKIENHLFSSQEKKSEAIYSEKADKYSAKAVLEDVLFDSSPPSQNIFDDIISFHDQPQDRIVSSDELHPKSPLQLSNVISLKDSREPELPASLEDIDLDIKSITESLNIGNSCTVFAENKQDEKDSASPKSSCLGFKKSDHIMKTSKFGYNPIQMNTKGVKETENKIPPTKEQIDNLVNGQQTDVTFPRNANIDEALIKCQLDSEFEVKPAQTKSSIPGLPPEHTSCVINTTSYQISVAKSVEMTISSNAVLNSTAMQGQSSRCTLATKSKQTHVDSADENKVPIDAQMDPLIDNMAKSSHVSERNNDTNVVYITRFTSSKKTTTKQEVQISDLITSPKRDLLQSSQPSVTNQERCAPHSEPRRSKRVIKEPARFSAPITNNFVQEPMHIFNEEMAETKRHQQDMATFDILRNEYRSLESLLNTREIGTDILKRKIKELQPRLMNFLSLTKTEGHFLSSQTKISTISKDVKVLLRKKITLLSERQLKLKSLYNVHRDIQSKIKSLASARNSQNVYKGLSKNICQGLTIPTSQPGYSKEISDLKIPRANNLDNDKKVGGILGSVEKTDVGLGMGTSVDDAIDLTGNRSKESASIEMETTLLDDKTGLFATKAYNNADTKKVPNLVSVSQHITMANNKSIVLKATKSVGPETATYMLIPVAQATQKTRGGITHSSILTNSNDTKRTKCSKPVKFIPPGRANINSDTRITSNSELRPKHDLIYIKPKMTKVQSDNTANINSETYVSAISEIRSEHDLHLVKPTASSQSVSKNSTSLPSVSVGVSVSHVHNNNNAPVYRLQEKSGVLSTTADKQLGRKHDDEILELILNCLDKNEEHGPSINENVKIHNDPESKNINETKKEIVEKHTKGDTHTVQRLNETKIVNMEAASESPNEKVMEEIVTRPYDERIKHTTDTLSENEKMALRQGENKEGMIKRANEKSKNNVLHRVPSTAMETSDKVMNDYRNESPKAPPESFNDDFDKFTDGGVLDDAKSLTMPIDDPDSSKRKSIESNEQLVKKVCLEPKSNYILKSRDNQEMVQKILKTGDISSILSQHPLNISNQGKMPPSPSEVDDRSCFEQLCSDFSPGSEKAKIRVKSYPQEHRTLEQLSNRPLKHNNSLQKMNSHSPSQSVMSFASGFSTSSKRFLQKMKDKAIKISQARSRELSKAGLVPTCPKLPSLSTLTRDGLLKPGKNNLTVKHKGKAFVASLLESGMIKNDLGEIFRTPTMWLSNVTGTMQNKKIKAYKRIFYKGQPMIDIAHSSTKTSQSKVTGHSIDNNALTERADDLSYNISTPTGYRPEAQNRSFIFPVPHTTSLLGHASQINPLSQQPSTATTNQLVIVTDTNKTPTTEALWKSEIQVEPPEINSTHHEQDQNMEIQKEIKRNLSKCVSVLLIHDSELISTPDIDEDFWKKPFKDVQLSKDIWLDVGNWDE